MRSPSPYKPIGEILSEKGLATRCQIELALALQQRLPDHRIGEILVQLGYVKTRDVARAYADQVRTVYAKSWAGWRRT